MATKIRLQRHGRKSYAFYSIVIADVRAPRDGKFTLPFLPAAVRSPDDL